MNPLAVEEACYARQFDRQLSLGRSDFLSEQIGPMRADADVLNVIHAPTRLILNSSCRNALLRVNFRIHGMPMSM